MGGKHRLLTHRQRRRMERQRYQLDRGRLRPAALQPRSIPRWAWALVTVAVMLGLSAFVKVAPEDGPLVPAESAPGASQSVPILTTPLTTAEPLGPMRQPAPLLATADDIARLTGLTGLSADQVTDDPDDDGDRHINLDALAGWAAERRNHRR